MDTSELLKWWHIVGIAATIGSVVAAEATPVVANYPKLSLIIGGLSAISLGITMTMNKLSSDKVFQALISDPSSPTPKGFGIPKPVVDGPISNTVQAANGNPEVVKAIIDSSVAANVVEHANAVLDVVAKDAGGQ